LGAAIRTLVSRSRRGTLALLIGVTSCEGGGAPGAPVDGGPATEGGPTGATGAVARLDEPVVFQSFDYGQDFFYPPCTCDRSQGMSVSQDGHIRVSFHGADMLGQLEPADLELFARYATSAALVTDLRTRECQQVADTSESMHVGVGPRLTIGGDIAGCGGQSVDTLVNAARLLARKVFPTSPFGRDAPEVLPPGPPARFAEPVRFGGFQLSGGELVLADVKAGTFQGGGHLWEKVTSFEPLASVAVRPDVVAALRTVDACTAAPGTEEEMTLTIGEGLALSARTTGCTDQALVDVRAAAQALLERLQRTATPVGP
jgi:hypothetical protein